MSVDPHWESDSWPLSSPRRGHKSWNAEPDVQKSAAFCKLWPLTLKNLAWYLHSGVSWKSCSFHFRISPPCLFSNLSAVPDTRAAVYLCVRCGLRGGRSSALFPAVTALQSGSPHTNSALPIVGNMSARSILTCSQIVWHRSGRQLCWLQT